MLCALSLQCQESTWKERSIPPSHESPTRMRHTEVRTTHGTTRAYLIDSMRATNRHAGGWDRKESAVSHSLDHTISSVARALRAPIGGMRMRAVPGKPNHRCEQERTAV